MHVGLENHPNVVEVFAQKENEGSREFIVFKNCRWMMSADEYAIGCCRQVTSQELGIPTYFGCASTSRHDHSCVLLRREANGKNGSPEKWQVQQSFATVELKTEKTSFTLKKRSLSSHAFASKTKAKKQRAVSRRNKKSDSVLHIEDPSTTAGLGALWQEIAYVLSETWTCIARVGAGENSDAKTARNIPPHQIPFAVISGLLEDQAKRDDRVDYPDNCRYALGYIHVPRICGDDYSYSLVASGTFSEDESVKKAAAAYLKVISFGIAMGKSVMKRIPGSYTEGTLRTALFHSMCGTNVYLGDHNVTKYFQRAEAPFNSNPFGEKINQGEMWKGGLSGVTDVPTKSNSDFGEGILLFVESISMPNLLLKTVTPMVHNPLCSPDHNWVALCVIAQVCPTSINSVLLAAQKRGHGSLLLMKDMRQLNYIDLRPQKMITDYGISLPTLWCSFCAMVERTLIPIAKLNMVFPDIRGGFDITANIVVSIDGTEMYLIDLDSLVLLANLPVTGNADRYLLQLNLSSFGYLWWQCLVVASMWQQKSLQRFGGLNMQNKLLTAIDGWSPSTEADVTFLLHAISNTNWFNKQDYTDEEIYDLVVTDDDG